MFVPKKITERIHYRIYNVEYFNHCDFEICDLGTAEYDCPNCQKINIDYDELWFNRYSNTPILVKCIHCKTELITYIEEFKTKIKIK